MTPTHEQPRRRPLGAVRAALLLVAVPLSAQPTQPTVIAPALLGARVDSIFDPWRGTDRPGCTVGIGTPSETLLERGYGMADIESGVPLTPDRIVHSASLTKQVTALAVLLLARDGRLSLDDDVRRYVPELPSYGERITIRHLLTHTNGLRDVFEMLILARGRFEESRITSADALDALVRQDALNFAPGSDHLYGNSSYLLTALIIARVSGQSYADFVQTRIFAPLGMTKTRIRDDVTRLIPGRAVGYARAGAGFRTSTPNFDVVGSTNMQTTVGDLLRLGRNLAHPRVGDSTTIRAMLSPTVLPRGDTVGYGLGLALIRDGANDVVEHEGSDPGFRAYFGWYRSSSVMVALLCNTSNLDPVGLGRRVARVATGEPVIMPTGARAPTAMDSAAARAALRWAGVYFEPDTRAMVELTIRDGTLYSDRVGGVRIEATGPHRAHLVGTPLDLLFDSTGVTEHPAYVVRSAVPGRRPDRFTWVAPTTWQPTATALKAYEGTYTNEALASEFHVSASDSTIVIAPRGGVRMTARPVMVDGFTSGQIRIQFRRSSGQITGLEITHPRARALPYERARRRR
ncbi:MAG: beta-lactamase family protein [Gemmatimonadaceae bacterium]|nr:beta-lactamase family protein [Gemmatimonadaceae bacterium]